MLKKTAVIAGVALLAASLAAGSSAAPDRRALRETTLLVKFKHGVSPGKRKWLLRFAQVEQVGSIPALGVLRVQAPVTQAQRALSRLAHANAVEYAERDGHIRVAGTTPSDPLFSSAASILAPTKLTSAWDVLTGGQVVVAVVDSGVSNVADLSGALLPGTDLVNSDSDATDDNGHGTAVAEVIAARANNGVGSAGVCWACQILPVKVAAANGSALDSAAAAGIVWAADHGAQIINLSLGGPDPSQTDADAVAYAQSKGALVVAAAGNSGTSVQQYPAAYPGVISVAAADLQDNRYSYSQYGDWVSIAAPTCLPEPSYLDGSTQAFCGTSGAAPIVSGIAALALTAAPSVSQSDLAAALEKTADAVPGTYVHSGRVNAAALLASLSATASPGRNVAPSSGAAAAPAVTAAPTITGTAQVGQFLTASPGTWQNASAFIYSWHRCDATRTTCEPIAGVSGPTYTPVQADADAFLFVRVTATGPGGEAMATSTLVGPVDAGTVAPTRVTLPTLNGKLKVGSTLTADPGSWQNAAGFAFQWLRCDASGQTCTTIWGVRGTSYKLRRGDSGHRVKVRVRAKGPGGIAFASSKATKSISR